MGIGSERFAGTPRASKWLQDYEAGHSQPSRRASSPGSSHTDEMVTYSWVCGCVSRGSALVWIEKRPCHLALDAKVSKKKKEFTHTKPKVSAPSVLLCLSPCCSRQGCGGAGRLLLQPGCRNCCWELQGSCGQE